ncbi:ribose transport system permease protein rbsC [Brachyspira pilosicoli WesB]|uniref:Ribose transport system permease protein rbsC n=1 Tax=Brachyspira pilosicoli WesB TaxID=1161918 RepID=K0JG65_BRAPL|nr:ABC transporter permease [Brachyspira pilosicoli]CCG55734.1 ribose transport system permease protein rbsC [Brachyspira pilosicoli WesB]
MIKLKNYSRELAVLAAILILIIVFTILDRSYLTIANLIDIVELATINSLIAIGITFTIITGGIDLSVGSIFAIVIVWVGHLTVLSVNPILAIILGCILGLLMGIVNGVLITKMHLQPFIATLGTMSVYRGLAYVLTGGWPIIGVPNNFRYIFISNFLSGIPYSVILMLIFAFITHIILKKLRVGNYLFAIGGNEEAAKLSGVNVDITKITAYAMCGLGSALAGMVMLANLGTGEPATGQGYELEAIAAAAIGGASLSGGKGSIIGTLLGALLLASLKIGLIVIGVDTFYQFIVTGAIIVIAAYFEIIQKKLSAFILRNKLTKNENKVVN